MGKLHHAMTGTGAVALAAAAAVPGTVVARAIGGLTGDGRVRFGHPSGTLTVGAAAERRGDGWVVTRAIMSRSARRLMEGHVRVPADVMPASAGTVREPAATAAAAV
jgi:2-methylaconitate cis-trans-isomerase PrpF